MTAPQKPSHKRRPATVVSYWPHAGVVLGLGLTFAGAITGSAELIASGSNVLTIAGLLLVQFNKNRNRQGEEDES